MTPLSDFRSDGFSRPAEHGAQIDSLAFNPRVLQTGTSRLAETCSQQRYLAHLSFDEVVHLLLKGLIFTAYTQCSYRILD
jgi:hypothetical protein